MGQAERRPPASPTMGSGSNSGVVISTSRGWLRMVVPQTGQSFNSSTMNFSKRTRVTIREVAAQAGVSIATVSNVLNGKAQRATPETVHHHGIPGRKGYASDRIVRGIAGGGLVQGSQGERVPVARGCRLHGGFQ